MPKVSFCIPNLNMVHWLERCVHSCLAQTKSNIEVVIVDNCSEDGSYELGQKLSMKDSRIKVLCNSSRLGMAANWNAAISHAQGEYVVLLCADDTQKPDFVEHLLPLIESRRHVSFAGGERNDINDKDQIIHTHQFYEASAEIPGYSELHVAIASNHSVMNQLLIRRRCWEQVGGFDERFDWAHDIHFKLKLLLAGDVVYSTYPVCNYRINHEASSSQMLWTKLGPMEIYRVRMDFLSQVPQSLSLLHNRIPLIRNNLAKLCIANGLKILWDGDSSENRRVAQEYLHLARSFDLTINEMAQYRRLEDALISGKSPDVCTFILPRPHKLPKGWRPLVPPDKIIT